MKKMLVAMAFVFSGCMSSNTTQMTPVLPLVNPTPANLAPDFMGTGIHNGSAVQLSKLRGKVVLLSFWTPTCGACSDEIPAEKQIFAKYSNQSFEMIGICGSRVKPSAQLASRINAMPWINIWDQRTIFAAYSVEAVPTFVLVAKDGSLAGRWVGGGQSLAIGAAIDKELAK